VLYKRGNTASNGEVMSVKMNSGTQATPKNVYKEGEKNSRETAGECVEGELTCG